MTPFVPKYPPLPPGECADGSCKQCGPAKARRYAREAREAKDKIDAENAKVRADLTTALELLRRALTYAPNMAPDHRKVFEDFLANRTAPPSWWHL